jgi:DNA ligase-1
MTPMLAYRFSGEDVAGWLLSEKFDGVRCILSGGKLWSRNGNEFRAPAWWMHNLPSGVVLDGELWIARGTGRRMAGVARRKTPVDAQWEQVRLLVFDAPEARCGFAERQKTVKESVYGFSGCRMIEQIPCLGRDHLEQMLDDVARIGGEGVVARRADSPYVYDRSMDFLKYKPRYRMSCRVPVFQ